MFKCVCLVTVLVLLFAKASPAPKLNQNKLVVDYLQAGLQGSPVQASGHPGQPAPTGRGYYAMAQQSLSRAPTQSHSYYRPSVSSGLPTVAACPKIKCHLALTIILDSSGSVGQTDFTKELAFTRAVIEILTVKAKEVNLEICLGVVKYSSNVEVTVNPCCGSSMCQVIDKFVNKEIVYKSGSTNTAGALKVARQMLQATSSYKKIALLITDGRSNVGGSPNDIAKSMRDEDKITILALGVTNSINKPELMAISGETTVREIADFDDFEELAELLLESNSMTSEELSSNINEICKKDKPKMKNVVNGKWGNWTTGSCHRIYKRMAFVRDPGRYGYGKCVKITTRQCNSPPPQCGGATCKGKNENFESCECHGPVYPVPYYGGRGRHYGGMKGTTPPPTPYKIVQKKPQHPSG